MNHFHNFVDCCERNCPLHHLKIFIKYSSFKPLSSVLFNPISSWSISQINPPSSASPRLAGLGFKLLADFFRINTYYISFFNIFRKNSSCPLLNSSCPLLNSSCPLLNSSCPLLQQTLIF